MNYPNSITAITVSLIIIVSLIMHVVINNDSTNRSILVLLITGVLPFAAGFTYIKTKKK